MFGRVADSLKPCELFFLQVNTTSSKHTVHTNSSNPYPSSSYLGRHQLQYLDVGRRVVAKLFRKMPSPSWFRIHYHDGRIIFVFQGPL